MPSSAGGQCPSDEAALSEILFVMWGYPELTQTFIHRELERLTEQGAKLRLLAAHRVVRDDLDQATANLADSALYLGHPARVSARASIWATQHPRRFSRVLSWALRLPHRTRFHRLRMAVMVVAAAAVAERVEGTDCGYLHAHFASYQTEWAWCLSRLTGLPFGFTAHATDIWKDNNLLAEKVRDARVVITCTQHNLEHLRGLAPDAANRVHLVRHGLDLEALGPITPQPNHEIPHWVAVGRLVEKKGFRHLIDAAARLGDRGHRARFTIVGGGPLEAVLRERIAVQDLADRVELRGVLGNREVLSILEDCTGLVVPSVRAMNGDVDGIPNVILEAAAKGRPVVASTLSGIPEAVVHGRTGLLVPPGDVSALADAIQSLGASPARAADLGRCGRALVEQDFDVAKNAARHCALLAQARWSRVPVVDPHVIVSPGHSSSHAA
ncbi:MAG: glycosyltransferase [Polyangiaceae bacterium]|nr:glycosyltransferase [Polyangiaceae bacterium]